MKTKILITLSVLLLFSAQLLYSSNSADRPEMQKIEMSVKIESIECIQFDASINLDHYNFIQYENESYTHSQSFEAELQNLLNRDRFVRSSGENRYNKIFEDLFNKRNLQEALSNTGEYLKSEDFILSQETRNQSFYDNARLNYLEFRLCSLREVGNVNSNDIDFNRKVVTKYPSQYTFRLASCLKC